MKPSILILVFAFLLFACEKENSSAKLNAAINFNVSEQLLKGKPIACVDFDSDGNAWIASGSSLLFYNGKNTQSYEVGSEILDVSAGSGGKVWVATKDRGLALLLNGTFTFYNMQNSGLPRDLIIAVEAAPDGTVWFSCSAHQLGGLAHYDGKNFKLYTPENSILNQNLVTDLKMDKSGNLFFSTEGTVNESKIYKIDNRGTLSAIGGDAKFYWIGALDVNSLSEAVVADDHSLSSCMGCYTNAVSVFRNGKWNKIVADFDVDPFNRMLVDKRDFVWVQGSIKGDYSSYFVYDGVSWHRSEKGQIPDAFIYSVKVDPDNNIWFCTNDGIFIVRQS